MKISSIPFLSFTSFYSWMHLSLKGVCIIYTYVYSSWTIKRKRAWVKELAVPSLLSMANIGYLAKIMHNKIHLIGARRLYETKKIHRWSGHDHACGVGGQVALSESHQCFSTPGVFFHTGNGYWLAFSFKSDYLQEKKRAQFHNIRAS